MNYGDLGAAMLLAGGAWALFGGWLFGLPVAIAGALFATVGLLVIAATTDARDTDEWDEVDV